MQQFQVPQFIDIEDRIIGPLTLKQFFYLLAATGVALITWAYLHIILFLFIGGPVAGLFVAMAFAKVNGRPFPTIFGNAINYYLKPRLYLWRQTQERKPGQSKASPATKEVSPLTAIPKLSESKLADLAWSLDVHEHIQ